MAESSKIIPVVALFTGGLGATLFSYFMEREEPVILVWSSGRAAVVASLDHQRMLPGLSVTLDGSDIESLFLHTISISPVSGLHEEPLTIAFDFKESASIFAYDATPPTSLHQFDCQSEGPSIRCVLGPFDSSRAAPFTLSVASTSGELPEVLCVKSGVTLLAAEEYAKKQGGFVEYLSRNIVGSLASGVVSVLFSFVMWLLARRFLIERVPLLLGHLAVGRIVDASGKPAQGVKVEVHDIKSGRLRVCWTDTHGDFYAGSSRAVTYSGSIVSVLDSTGRLLVRREFDTPIMLVKLPNTQPVQAESVEDKSSDHGTEPLSPSSDEALGRTEGQN